MATAQYVPKLLNCQRPCRPFSTHCYTAAQRTPLYGYDAKHRSINKFPSWFNKTIIHDVLATAIYRSLDVQIYDKIKFHDIGIFSESLMGPTLRCGQILVWDLGLPCSCVAVLLVIFLILFACLFRISVNVEWHTCPHTHRTTPYSLATSKDIWRSDINLKRSTYLQVFNWSRENWVFFDSFTELS